MNTSEEKWKEKKKVNAIKTFPVPYGLVTSNEHNFNTNVFLFESSKEQIIKKALKSHSLGDIKEATKYYKYCIEKDFNDYRIFSNYGYIQKQFGKSKEAEILLKKAIKIKPNLASLHCDLGNILRDLGKLKEAERSLLKAINIEPKSPYAYCNLGGILMDLGKSKEAEIPTLLSESKKQVCKSRFMPLPQHALERAYSASRFRCQYFWRSPAQNSQNCASAGGA